MQISYQFFMFFMLGHLLGDFVFQTNKIARMKSEGTKGLLIHTAVVLAAQTLLLGVYGLNGVFAGAICAVVHFYIDYYKVKLNKFFKKLELVYFVLDQTVHIALIFLFTLLFGKSKELPENLVDSVAILIMLVILVFVSTVLVKIVLRNFIPGFVSDVFFRKNERIIDALVSVIMWGICNLRPLFAVIAFILVLYLYYRHQKHFFRYENKAIAIKCITLAIISIAVFYMNACFLIQ